MRKLCKGNSDDVGLLYIRFLGKTTEPILMTVFKSIAKGVEESGKVFVENNIFTAKFTRNCSIDVL